jgi:dihydrofolate synthase/folylpolyglutamate synthase
MGGRLDSTNIITPILSVITNIGWDHMQFLGDTLPKIAAEKAGIIKPGVPVIIGERQEETDAVFTETAARTGAALTFAEDEWEVENHQFIREDRIYLRMHLLEAGTGQLSVLDTDLTGLYQLRNMITVRSAIEALRKSGIPVSNEAMFRGLRHIQRNTGLMGRWQILQEEPLVIADAGHNLPGMQMVLRQLEAYTYTKLRMVIGFVKDKDIHTILHILPKEAVYYFTRADLPRSLDAAELRSQASEFGLKGEAYATVKTAMAAALADSGPGDLVFIGGSSFVVAEAI